MISSCAPVVVYRKQHERAVATITDPKCETSRSLTADGSESLPYPIFEVADIERMRTENTAHYVLCSDLDFSSVSFTPIASFQGVFDGNHKTIDNFSYSTTTSTAGFFIDLQNATVKNLTFDHANVSSLSTGGVLASYLKGDSVVQDNIIKNSTISGRDGTGLLLGAVYQLGFTSATATVSGNKVSSSTVNYVGGGWGQVASLIGYSYGFATNSILIKKNWADQVTIYSAATNNCSGGLLGVVYHANIEENFVDVAFTRSAGRNLERAGGLYGCGLPNGASVINAKNNIVQFTGLEGDWFGRIGGIMGDMNSGVTITISSNLILGTVEADHMNTKGMIFGNSHNVVYVNDNFWLEDGSGLGAYNSGIASVTNTRAISSSEILDPSIFNVSDWTNTAIWKLENGSRPVLSWQ